MTYIILTIWALAFIAVGTQLAAEIMIAEWKFDQERRAWAKMIHNRKLNNRLFVERQKVNTLYRRGGLGA